MSTNRVLSELLKAQREGKLKGVYGRLGNLGTIQDQYDVAISTACGHLDFIVVDTVAVGEHCINYLRENRIGRASFICLDRISQQVGALCK